MTYRKIVAITPNDNVDLPDGIAHAIWCSGSAGNVVIIDGSGTQVTLPIASGFDVRLTVKAMRVRATSTTATVLYACYV